MSTKRPRSSQAVPSMGRSPVAGSSATVANSTGFLVVASSTVPVRRPEPLGASGKARRGAVVGAGVPGAPEGRAPAGRAVGVWPKAGTANKLLSNKGKQRFIAKEKIGEREDAVETKGSMPPKSIVRSKGCSRADWLPANFGKRYNLNYIF